VQEPKAADIPGRNAVVGASCLLETVAIVCALFLAQNFAHDFSRRNNKNVNGVLSLPFDRGLVFLFKEVKLKLSLSAFCLLNHQFRALEALNIVTRYGSLPNFQVTRQGPLFRDCLEIVLSHFCTWQYLHQCESHVPKPPPFASLLAQTSA
jgi:hypothetical protein